MQLYPNADAILAAYGCKGSGVDPTGSADGSYTCTVPSDVSQVLLAAKGDVSSDGGIDIGDVSALYAHVRQQTLLTWDT